MRNQNVVVRGWLIYLIVLLALATVFLIWRFVIREDIEPQTITTTMVETAEEAEDETPEGFIWYNSDDPSLAFLHPRDWNLFKREFGNAPNVEKADIALTASDFDLSYFAKRGARVILDLPEERFCQETKNLRQWEAFVGGLKPTATNDERCADPELLLINNYLSPAFADDGKSIFRYGIFLPFSGGGGLVFSDSVPIPEEATISTKGTIIDEMKAKLRSRVAAFANNNQQLLPAPQPSEE